MSAPFLTTRRVEFSDTDAAGIMHFTAYFRMLEQAEHELLRSVGLSVEMPDADGKLSWPRASARCDFQAAAKFEDVLQIEVRVKRLGNRSVTYSHRISSGGRPIATGEITAVCCRILPGKPPQPVPIPSEIAEKLLAFVGTREAA